MSAVPINRHCGFVFQKVSPLVKKRAFRWYGFLFFKYGQPVLFRLFKERVAVYIVHEHDSEHGGQPREAPCAFDSLLHDHEQQVCNERHPYLYLDGVGALSVEIPQREILFELLVQVM